MTPMMPNFRPLTPPRGKPTRPLDETQTLDHDPTLEGTVARVIYDKGFGFILFEGKEYFFHANELENCSSIEQVKRGMKARFTAEDAPKGPRATSVTILGM